MKKFAIVSSRFNAPVVNGLLEGAMEYLKQKKLSPEQIDIYHVPGSFEIPLIAKKAAESGHYAGIICLGAVIKGETAHFEFISLGATVGIMDSMLKTGIPISFGVLTTYNDEQANARSQPGSHNKGREAAAACFEAAEMLVKIATLPNR